MYLGFPIPLLAFCCEVLPPSRGNKETASIDATDNGQETRGRG